MDHELFLFHPPFYLALTFHVGDEFIFCRNDEKDDFWHCGEGTLDEDYLQSPGTTIQAQKAFLFVQKHGMLLKDIIILFYKVVLLCVDG